MGVNLFAETAPAGKNIPSSISPDAFRKDGTKKGVGFLGALKRPDGRTSTEVSIGIEFDGKEAEIPSLVRTLTSEEIEYIRTTKLSPEMWKTPIGKKIVPKAIDHAKERMEKGLSPFYQKDEGKSKSTGTGRNLFASGVKDRAKSSFTPLVMPEQEGLYEGFVKPTIKDIGKNIVAAGETGLSFGTGAALWPFSKAYGLMALPFGEDVSRQAEQDIAGLAYEPRTGLGKQSTETLGKAFEIGLTPARMAGEGVKELVGPRAGYIAELVSELAMFKIAHSAGKKIAAPKKAEFEKKLAKLSPEELSEVQEAAFKLDDTYAKTGPVERGKELVPSHKPTVDMKQPPTIERTKPTLKALPPAQGFELVGKPKGEPSKIKSGEVRTEKKKAAFIDENLKLETKRKPGELGQVRRFGMMEPGKPKSPPAETGTLRGQIVQAGGIRSDQFDTLFKDRAPTERALSRRRGRRIDELETELREDGFLLPTESLADALKDSKRLGMKKLSDDKQFKFHEKPVEEPPKVKAEVRPEATFKEQEGVVFQGGGKGHDSGFYTTSPTKARIFAETAKKEGYDPEIRAYKVSDMPEDLFWEGDNLLPRNEFVKKHGREIGDPAKRTKPFESISLDEFNKQKPTPKAEAKAKEPWEMSKAEYRGRYKKGESDKVIVEKIGSSKPEDILNYYKKKYPELKNTEIEQGGGVADVMLTKGADEGMVKIDGKKFTIRITKVASPTTVRHEIEHLLDEIHNRKPGFGNFSRFRHKEFPADYKHRQSVKQAISDGLKVSESVLKDYPELKAKPKYKAIKIYRGESAYNKDGSYYTKDKEWARQFTQSGLDKEIKETSILEKDIYKAEPLPRATSEKDFDVAISEAKKKGFGAAWFDEGPREPNSIFVIDKSKTKPKVKDILKSEKGAIEIDLSIVRDVGKGAKEAYKDIKKMGDEYLGSISTRLGNIDPELKNHLRKYEFRQRRKILKDTKRVLPMLKKIKKMSAEDQRIFDLARKNGGSKTIQELMLKYDMAKEYKETRKVLNEMYDEAQSAGFDVGYREHFHPRVIKDTEGFLTHFQKGTDWPLFDKAIKEKEVKLGRYLEADEKAQVINTMLRGYEQGGIRLSKPGQLKARTIEKITPELNKFYMSADASLIQYINKVTAAVEARKIFGKGENINDSIGHYILDLIAKGKITPKNEVILRDILNARFNEKGTRGVVGMYKNLSYIDTMGSPISAITQIGDLSWALYKNGIPRTASAVVTAVRGKSLIKPKDLGIERIAEEFTEPSRLSSAVNTVFKAVGLEKIDFIGKETLITSTIKKAQSQAKSKNLKKLGELKAELRPIFGDETMSLITDLREGNISENVKLYAFNVLSDFQPIALAEMPQKYLTGGNGRIFYMLKTFTIKQFDVYRKEVFQKIKTPGTRIKGIRNLVRLAAFFVAANATADTIKSLILNRPLDPEDLLVDNILRLFGISKFVTWKARSEGVGSALVRQVAPPFKFIDAATKDINRAGDEKGLETTSSIPLVGKLYYWWLGKGAKKSEKRRKKKSKTTKFKGMSTIKGF